MILVARLRAHTIPSLFLATTPSIASFAAQTPRAHDIRRVDFQAFTYTPWCTDKPVTTTGGAFQRETGDDQISFKVLRVSYGDVNGDGREEALVLTSCNTGGTGSFSDAFVFRMAGGTPQLMAKAEGGDRADGGIYDIAVENGRLVFWKYGDTQGACCPGYVDRWATHIVGGTIEETRRLGRTLVLEDKDQRSSVPIRFTAGASTATVEGATMTRVTYRAIARAGQTMTVRLQSRKAPTLTVLGKDDVVIATVKAGQEWTGRLPVAGVYRFRVQTDFYVSLFTIKVEIR